MHLSGLHDHVKKHLFTRPWTHAYEIQFVLSYLFGGTVAYGTLPFGFLRGGRPVRVLFLGHEATHHPSDDYYPMLAKALGREAIYFDYVTSVEEALGNADYLNRFDTLLLYANHGEITPTQWANLLQFVEKGHGFLPIHCASWCFANEPGFDQLVGGRFAHHRTECSPP